MPPMLDLDQLRTFVAIAETGSFTRAAETVHRTQSAVSMQMRRLEERLDKPLFVRHGRASRLSSDGERLVGYARRMIKLNDETMAVFDDSELSGSITLGTPTDYAARFLPEVLARFAQSNPLIEVTVICESSVQLSEITRAGEVDLAIVTMCSGAESAEIIRREPLYWVTSTTHRPEAEEVLPLALDKPPCLWRAAAIESLLAVGRRHRVVYTSANSTAIAATVESGLAVSVLAESALQPGMRILSEAEGFPQLPMCDIGLVRARASATSPVVDALSAHIVASLHNLSAVYAESA
ncbi:MAG: LysR substrate-binding domain-containing protein [Alphaproteobacteria bacterium]